LTFADLVEKTIQIGSVGFLQSDCGLAHAIPVVLVAFWKLVKI
jgi:hypothetical protein